MALSVRARDACGITINVTALVVRVVGPTMVMAGVAIVASDNHYRGAGTVSRIVRFCISAVVRRVIAVVAIAVVAIAVIAIAVIAIAVIAIVVGVRRGRRCADKSAREEAGGHWQKPRLSRSRFGSCQRSSAEYHRSAE